MTAPSRPRLPAFSTATSTPYVAQMRVTSFIAVRFEPGRQAGFPENDIDVDVASATASSVTSRAARRIEENRSHTQSQQSNRERHNHSLSSCPGLRRDSHTQTGRNPPNYTSSAANQQATSGD